MYVDVMPACLSMHHVQTGAVNPLGLVYWWLIIDGVARD